MDLVARRNVVAAEIESKLEKQEFDTAKKILSSLRKVTDSTEFNIKVANERKRLQQSSNSEAGHIAKMFDDLINMSGTHLSSSMETELGAKIQTAIEGGDWRNVALDETTLTNQGEDEGLLSDDELETSEGDE